MRVINLFAGPGSGKSTTAAGLFFLLKSSGSNSELVTEFAKQLVWQERYATFSDQLYILAKQNHKLHALNGKVEYAITDSPLLLSSIYAPQDYIDGFHSLVRATFDRYDNLNFFIRRVKPYNPVGRNQNESEAKAIDLDVKNWLDKEGVPYFEVDGDKNAPQIILNCLDKVVKLT
jgi:hypothetical protein